jgi:hypothetical protein
MTEAKALSAAGDFALALLEPAPKQYAKTAAACVRALRLIGTEAALDVLARYGSDTRSTVIDELIAAWPFFNRSEFARRVLAGSRGVRGRLRIDIFPLLEGLRYLKNIQGLTINAFRYSVNADNFREILHLTNLRYFALFGRAKFDCSVLRNLAGLVQLHIRAEEITGLEELRGHTNLRQLRLGSFSPLKGLEVIQSLTSLRQLVVDSHTVLDSVDWLTSLPELEALDVGRLSETVVLNGFSNLKKLKALRLTGSVSTNVIPILSGLRNLKHLTLALPDRVEDLTLLGMCNQLLGLSVVGGKNLKTLNGVDKLAALTHLNLVNCPELIDISSIAPLINIKKLSIYGTPKLDDMSALGQMKGLIEIGASIAEAEKIKTVGVRAHVRPRYIYDQSLTYFR